MINGQKMWTSGAHTSTYVWLAARTDPNAPEERGPRFAVPVESPGITVRPIWIMSGGRTNETFYEDVRVPADAMIGEENRGWYIATVALALRSRFWRWHRRRGRCIFFPRPQVVIRWLHARIGHRFPEPLRGIMTQSRDVKTLLGLRVPPVAIGLFAEPPSGVARYGDAPTASGCTFWEIAQRGHVFYTLPDDHHCAVGSYTHHMSPAPGADLNGAIELMVEQRYIRPQEVAGIPTLAQSPRVVAYAPVDADAFAPAVVIVAAQPAQAMLLFEAAVRSGASGPVAPLIARPGCAVVPQVVEGGLTALSFGCIGNRTYTGLPDGELYLAVPGASWRVLTDALQEIVEANTGMASHYERTL